MDDTAASGGCYPTLILTAIYDRFERGIHLPGHVDIHARRAHLHRNCERYACVFFFPLADACGREISRVIILRVFHISR